MLPMALFITTFSLYLFRMAPSFTVGDAGELCAAGVILGLPHSPGYPLYCLLAKLFSVLVPWGSAAYRINLLSAAAGAAAVTVAYGAVTALLPSGITDGKRRAIALVSALLLAVSPAFTATSVQAEVFSLNALFAAAIVYASLKGQGLLASYLFGLGLGNHHTLLFVGPFLLAGFLMDENFTARRVAAHLLCFAAGISVYAYLPLRSHKNPALDWGNPETLHNLWRVVSRADYGSLSLTVGEKMARTLDITFRQLGRYGASLVRQFTLPGALLGAAGWYLLLRKKNGTAWRIFLTWVLIGPGFLLLANMPFSAQTTGILERFYVLGNLFWIFAIAAALAALFGRVPTVAVCGLGIAAVAAAASLNPGGGSWRDYYLAYDYGRNLLRTLPRNAVFFMDGGDDTFYSMAYFCFAEKRRPDVELHDRGGLVFRNAYGADFRSLPRELKEARRQQIETAYRGVRPLVYSTFNREILPGIGLDGNGILYNEKSAAANGWPAYSLRSLYRDYDDYRSRALLPVYPYFGAFYAGKEKLRYWRYAMERWPDAEWLEKNLRIELAGDAYRQLNAGDISAAKESYAALYAWFPQETSALVNLGVIAEREHQESTAKEYYRTAITADPSCADAYYNMAVLFWKEANWNEVVKHLERLAVINPGDGRVRQYLPVAQARLKAAAR